MRGPTEFLKPQALATEGENVLVFLRGRLSRWRLQGDSLAFERALPLPSEFFPLGAVPACENGDRWLVYARNDAQIFASPEEARNIPRVDYLFRLGFSPKDEAVLEPLWSEDRDLDAVPVTGHEAGNVARTGNNLVILHRSSAYSAGKMLELNCGGELLRSHSERAIAVGDSLEVRIPRTRPMEWTSGIAALPNGFVNPLHRYYSPRVHRFNESHYRTELFRFVDGDYLGSVDIPGQGAVLDYDVKLGLLMATDDPIPHFIRLSLSELFGSA